MTAQMVRERHSGHRHNDEEKSCTRWRFSYFYDIIGGRGGRSHGENLYSRGTGEVQQGGANAHALGHAGPDGADERELGKPDRANPGPPTVLNLNSKPICQQQIISEFIIHI